MKAYVVMGSWNYQGEDCQGVWMSQAEAEQWVEEYMEARCRYVGYLPWDDLQLFEVEGSDFKLLVSWNTLMQKSDH